MYGFLAIDCGLQHSEIDRMTLHDAGMYYDYAAKRPTVRMMVAAYLGVKSPGPAQDMGDLLAMFGDGTIR